MVKGKSGQRSKRHHTVQKAYLKGFATREEKLFHIPVDHPEWASKVGVESATVIPDYYTLTLLGGEKTDIFEKAMAKLESAAIVLIVGLNEGTLTDPTDEEFEIIAGWIALHHLRNPVGSENRDAIAESVVKLWLSVGGLRFAAEQFEKRENRWPSLEELRSEWEKIKTSLGYSISLDHNTRIKLFSEMIEPMTSHLLTKEWFIIKWKFDSLITGDNPVVLIPHPRSGPHAPEPVAGWENAKAIAVPIGRKAALILYAPSSQLGIPLGIQEREGDSSMAEELNRLIKENARERVYAHPNELALAKSGLPVARQARETIDFAQFVDAADRILAKLLSDHNPEDLSPDARELSRLFWGK